MTSRSFDHIRPLLCQNNFSTFLHEPILMKIGMNANTMKTHKQYMTWNVTLMLLRSFVIFSFKTVWPNYYTIDFVLMDNFCPCFLLSLRFRGVFNIQFKGICPWWYKTGWRAYTPLFKYSSAYVSMFLPFIKKLCFRYNKIFGHGVNLPLMKTCLPIIKKRYIYAFV